VGFSDGIYGEARGRDISGWKCEHLPLPGGTRQRGVRPQPGSEGRRHLDLGYDEITWSRTEQAISRRLAALFLGLGAEDRSSAFLQMPGSRTRGREDNRRCTTPTCQHVRPDGLGDEDANGHLAADHQRLMTFPRSTMMRR